MLSVLLEVYQFYWGFLFFKDPFSLFYWFFSVVSVFNFIDFCPYLDYFLPAVCCGCVSLPFYLSLLVGGYITDLRFLSFLMYLFGAIAFIFFQRRCRCAPQSWYVAFPFSFSSSYYLISPGASCFSHGLFRNVFPVSTYLEDFFSIIFLLPISNLISLWLELFSNCWGLLYWPGIRSILVRAPQAIEKEVYAVVGVKWTLNVYSILLVNGVSLYWLSFFIQWRCSRCWWCKRFSVGAGHFPVMVQVSASYLNLLFSLA